MKEEKTKKKDDIKILFWNIAGLKNKLNEINTFIKSFDIIGLIETWVEQKNWENVKKYLPAGWKWKYFPASRIKKKGRAIGGIVTGVRREILELQGEVINKQNIQERRVKLDGKTYRIMTIYSKADDEEDIWQILKEGIEDWEEEAIMVGGDFNARIGDKGAWIKDFIEEEEQNKRSSKDRTFNLRGRKLLEECDEKGWHVLNGNTLGDENGNFTYIGEKGASVIDFVIGNDNALRDVEYFKIEENINSDHLPLTVRLNRKLEREKEKKMGKKVVQIWNEETIKKYKENNIKTKFDPKSNVNEEMDELVKKIKELTETKEVERGKVYKEKWWDIDCRMKRRELQKSLKRVRKDLGTIDEYRKKRKEYKELCKQKKERKKEEYIEQIKNITKEKEVWEHVNKGRKSRTQIASTITKEEWRMHFMELLDGKENQIGAKECLKINTGLNQKEVTKEEIEKQIRKLKKEKAAGEDEVKNEAWLYAEEPVKGKLLNIIQRVYRGEGFPRRWRIGNICPIFKKGDKEKAENYRGVTLLNTSYKLYAMVLNERLKEESERILPESQAGFRRGRSAMDHIYTLNWIIEKELKNKGGKLYAFFADLRSAFDMLDREKLWKVMEKKEADKELTEKIKEIYEETICTVKVNGEETKNFWTIKGVRQGCPLSPSLFALYISEIDEILARAQMGGVVVGKEKIWTLSYADDLVMMAKTEKEMKEMLKTLENYLKNRKLELNVEKSKMVEFNKGRGRMKEIVWNWKEENIEQVKEFTYLGYTFHKNNGPEKHIRSRCKKAVIAMRQVWGIGKRLFENDFERRMMLFDYLVKSVLFYGVEVWGWKQYDMIETIQDRFLRWTLELDRCTPGYIVREETKREMMRVDAGNRALKYEMKKRDSAGKLLKACFTEIDKVENGGKWIKGREDYFKRNGWSVEEGIKRCLNKENKMMKKLRDRDVDIQMQDQRNKIDNSRYNQRYKDIVEKNLPDYLKKKGRKGSQKIRARLRCGNEELQNRYWENEEKRTCRMCGKEEETLEHMGRTCLQKSRTDECIRTLLTTEKGEEWMRRIKETREERNK